jgi:hypothetical protein
MKYKAHMNLDIPLQQELQVEDRLLWFRKADLMTTNWAVWLTDPVPGAGRGRRGPNQLSGRANRGSLRKRRNKSGKKLKKVFKHEVKQFRIKKGLCLG